MYTYTPALHTWVSSGGNNHMSNRAACVGLVRIWEPGNAKNSYSVYDIGGGKWTFLKCTVVHRSYKALPIFSHVKSNIQLMCDFLRKGGNSSWWRASDSIWCILGKAFFSLTLLISPGDHSQKKNRKKLLVTELKFLHQSLLCKFAQDWAFGETANSSQQMSWCLYKFSRL